MIKKAASILAIFLMFAVSSFGKDVIVKNDNGTPRTSGYESRPDWEESVLLNPDGPCQVKEIHIYLTGDQASTDEFRVMGDPAEGAYPPTLWVKNYNTLIPPIQIDYDGNPGWRKIKVDDLRLGGLDRVWIIHGQNFNGPWIALDTEGSSSHSWYMDPNNNNQLGFPGVYYRAGSNFMVRLVVEYTYPTDSTSQGPPPPSFVDVTEKVGIINNGNVPGSGIVSITDWNKDGYSDLTISTLFYENNGDGTFKNISDNMKTPGQPVWADVDNDGNLDCFSRRGMNRDKMFWGKSDGTLEEDTDSTLILDQPTVTPMWLDYNRDGLLDLFIAYGRTSNQGQETYYPDQLFKNLGNRKFENVTDAAKISDGEPAPYYDCWGASICDYNNDLLPDVFVATYRLAPDLLYKNNGDGTFNEVGQETGARGAPTAQAGYFGHGMGSDWGDYNNDGAVDLAVGNLGHPDWRGQVSNPSLIFKNEGPPDYNFQNVQPEIGLKFFEMNAGMCWADLNLDGYLDLFHCQYSYDKKGDGVDRLSRLYINQGPENDYELKDLTWEYGATIHGAWSPVRLDYDNDGDMDLLIASAKENVKLFRNDLPSKGKWLQIKLNGSPENNVNMDAFGSSITVYAGGKSFLRSHPGSIMNARASQSTNICHFGLGDVEKIDSVVITYPDGKKLNLNDLKVNGKYTVNYDGSYEAELMAPRLISPGNYTYGIDKGTTSRLTANVAAETDTVTIMMSRDKAFKDVLYNETMSKKNGKVTGEVFINVSYLACNTYYWKAIASDDQGNTAESSVWEFTVCQPKPGKLQLTEPSNSATDVSAKPIFRWEAAEYKASYGTANTMYIFQLSDSPDFSNIIKTDTVSELKFTVTDFLDPETEYHWRVAADNNGLTGEWSDIYSFTTAAAPKSVILTSPANNAEDVDLRPKLYWESVDDADRYQLLVALDAEFNDTLVWAPDVIFTPKKLTEDLPDSTDIYWKVRAISAGGPGEWSETWMFTTKKDMSSVYEHKLTGISVQNVPNPFSGSTTFELNLSKTADIRLEIFDNLGNKIETVADEYLETGYHLFVWEPSNLPSGSYYYRLQTNEGITGGIIIYNK